MIVALGILWPLIVRAQQIQTPNISPSQSELTITIDAKTTIWYAPLKNATTSIEQMVRDAFPDAPIMVQVARAESQFVATAKNPNSTATGVFQILTGTWRDAKCQGDIKNATDNIACARILYDESGTTPWLASKSMWGQLH